MNVFLFVDYDRDYGGTVYAVPAETVDEVQQYELRVVPISHTKG